MLLKLAKIIPAFPPHSVNRPDCAPPAARLRPATAPSAILQDGWIEALKREPHRNDNGGRAPAVIEASHAILAFQRIFVVPRRKEYSVDFSCTATKGLQHLPCSTRTTAHPSFPHSSPILTDHHQIPSHLFLSHHSYYLLLRHLKNRLKNRYM